jgi:hypothetical protein
MGVFCLAFPDFLLFREQNVLFGLFAGVCLCLFVVNELFLLSTEMLVCGFVGFSSRHPIANRDSVMIPSACIFIG